MSLQVWWCKSKIPGLLIKLLIIIPIFSLAQKSTHHPTNKKTPLCGEVEGVPYFKSNNHT